MKPHVDKQIGPYKLQSFVRPGRVGDVYQATARDGSTVWVKVVHDEFFSEKQAIARFEREAQLLSDIDDPSMLNILKWGRSDNAAWLAIEAVEGPTLKDALAPGPLHINDVRKLAMGLAKALASAHSRRMIIRDVVPENILLVNSDPQNLKLLDLGFTRLVGMPVVSDLKTSHDTRIGDPTYMAPEYIEDSGLDHRADLYSMGIVLYQALTGKAPFTGKPFEIMLAQVSDRPIAPVALRPDTPPALQHLILSLLEKEPKRRPQNAKQVMALLGG